MADNLKDNYNLQYIESLAKALKKNYKPLKTKDFCAAVFNEDWQDYELKDRMRHITLTMGQFLPEDYEKAVAILLKSAGPFGGFEGMFFPDFIEVFGMEKQYRKLSLDALRTLTQYSSSEFAIRPFLIEDLESTMHYMQKNASSKNEHIRRFASEGCRPRLPWAMALPELKKDPQLILPILESLKNDDSLYVRKSVANNLNDISKDHPALALRLGKKWVGKKENQNWIVKHGLRTLLKQGESKALNLFGYGNPKDIKLKKLKLHQTQVGIGKTLEFEFQYQALKDMKVRVEYALYFLRKNGEHSKKVFKVSEKEIKKGIQKVLKAHSFKIISTRVYYPGIQKLAIIINGEEYKLKEFNLYEPKDWFVYMIETDKGALYTGITTDVERRFQEHREGGKGAKYFRGQKPKKIVHREVFESRSEALKREAEIKSFTPKKKRALITK